jgi:hypothetical protein
MTMMYRCLYTITLVFICNGVFAQFDDNFGKLRQQDIDLKVCSFDPSASLVITLDEGTTVYNNLENQVTYRHVRMKVLKEEGLKYADFSFTYPGRWDYVEIDRLEGKCINIGNDGKLNEFPVDKKSIYNRKVNKFYRQISFAFPQVKVGSILEYRYRIINKRSWDVRDWDFQKTFPVYQSSYHYTTHPSIEVSYSLQKKAEYPVIIKQEPKGNAILFQMNNIPAMEDEPYMDSRENNLQKVQFRITKYSGWIGFQTFNTSWKEVADVLRKYKGFGTFLNTYSRDINVFVGSLTKNESPFMKMKLIHDYVRKNIEYNDDDQFYADNDLVKLWHEKKGSSGDINLLLVYMLRSAGLATNPVLISERGNGRVEKSVYDLDQFSNVYAQVIIDGKKYYLDGTDKRTPCGFIQTDILNTHGLVVKPDTEEIVLIEEQDNKYKNILVIEGNLQDDGQLQGTVQITSREYAKYLIANTYKDAPADYVDKSIKSGLVNMQIDSFKISNLDKDSLPLIQHFKFRTSVQRSGDYDFAALNLFTGFLSNPFLAESRVSDINFGYKSSYTVSFVLNLPRSKAVDELPKNIQLVNEDKSLSFSRQVVYNEQAHQLVARMKIELNKSLFPTDQYFDLKEFYKKLNNLLEEPCTIKNK